MQYLNGRDEISAGKIADGHYGSINAHLEWSWINASCHSKDALKRAVLRARRAYHKIKLSRGVAAARPDQEVCLQPRHAMGQERRFVLGPFRQIWETRTPNCPIWRISN